MSEVKETKAQRIERLKRAKNPWECVDEIRGFARRGFDSIPPEWLQAYFRSWGIYTQGDGNGVVGGANGEGKAVPYFMMRIRVPNGILRSEQLRLIARLAAQHAQGVADLTVRQNIQLHWVTIEALPEILERLWAAGLTTTGACGDVARNVTGCPLAGVDADEICDASPVALAISRELAGNPEFYNLPRKFKISITGCRSWCTYPEINDVGLTATTRANGNKEIGFSLRVGGGLSADPHFGVKLDAFVAWDQAVPVVRGVAQIFRDSEILRQSREQARLKFLFMKHGWTAKAFLARLEERIGFQLDPAEPEGIPDDVYRDHVGVHVQRQAGLVYIGAAVLRGRITPEQMNVAADVADRYGSGELRNTNMQNLIIVNIGERDAAVAARELGVAGLHVRASSFARGTIACIGSEFCKLALTETKGFARWLVEQLDDRIPGFDQHLKLHITGCPNSCGQHWIADIGIEGKKIKMNGELVDAYYFCVGGAVGKHQAFARPIGYRCIAAEVPDAIERVLRSYQSGRRSGENLRQYFARHSSDEIRTLFAGGASEGFERDAAAGPVPHAVEG